VKISVSLENREAFLVDTRPVDMVRFEDVAQKHKWGTAAESPMRFVYFLAFAACCREGHFERARGFDAFMEELVDAEPEDNDENPTDPGPTPG
jgi:hypothetical protein